MVETTPGQSQKLLKTSETVVHLYSGCLLDLVMMIQPGGGYTTAGGWTGLSG